MSLHSSSSVFTMRHPVRRSAADPKLFAAVALLIAVLIADAILISAAAPSLVDLGSLYLTTT